MNTSLKRHRRALLLAAILASVPTATVQAQTTPEAGESVEVTSEESTWIQPVTGNAIDIPAGANGVVINNGQGGQITSSETAIRTEAQTTINNGGNIAGGFNGIDFVNGLGSGSVNNVSTGTISSGSRAINIGGAVQIENSGSILGTGDQRNGTVYSDSSANNFSINNNVGATIDAGAGNLGAGFSAELSELGTSFSINNAGTIAGRGDAGAGAATAGDGIRLERTRVDGALDGSTTGLFTGSITNSGTISSEGANATVGGFRAVNGTSFQGTLDNSGTIEGTQNGVYFGNATPAGGGDHTGGVVNNTGTISSDSRAFNIDGTGLTVNNDGQIIATGTQRNGTVYADSTAQDFTLNNNAGGVIDAGAGLEGAGFSAELSAAGNNFSINNAGTIAGRGDAGAGATAAGDGIRLERARVDGALDGSTTGLFTGSITNSGTISSEGANATVGGFRAVNGVDFQGTLDNSGTIEGTQNGVYFGNATPAGGGDHTGGVVNNTGTISSDSRAFNIDGTGLTVNNDGQIIATGTQRNGTVYADSTAQDFTLNNNAGGVIDAGAGLEGAGFSAELSTAGNNFSINNAGTIAGRGDAGAGATAAGDGIRLERARVDGALDGSTTGLFTGSITNSGTISSEGANATVGGFRAVNGVDFQGTLDNSGTISGTQNGVYFGNATPAGGGDHTGGVVNNTGTISSDSRAFNIDGTGLTVNNDGQIIATGTQRNGTVYADSTAQDFTLNNNAGGVIDAGAGLEGAGFSAELSTAGNNFSINNAGTIAGRGDAGAGATAAGDGIRLERARVDGVLEGSTTGLFTGSITNSGTISSEGANATVGGFRAVNGVDFQGTLDNSGTISGTQNGVYFGNATPAGGGDHTGGVVNNTGTISSDSRAFNIDGTGLTVNNDGQIIATGNQRNGTVYADSTAQDFTLNNNAGGVIDAGAGLEGAGFSAELSTAGNNFSINNAGTIAGRGDAGAGATAAGDGIRLERARVDGVLEGSTTGLFTGSITNSGTISSEGANGTVGGFRAVNGVDFQGTLDNSGTISGTQNGVYFGNATPAGGGDHTGGVVNNTGTISSDSRAFNIDGTGLQINNRGNIVGTGDQRNGTVYADSTAQDFTLNNRGTIDAGSGNLGAGFSAELSAAGNDFTITNSGAIVGRGTAGAGEATAGDGIRLERQRAAGGVLDGSSTGAFTGVINNSGTISSEGNSGTTAGFRAVNGVSFQGTLNNTGDISGVQNGVYFGNAVPAGGADHTGGVVNNSGTITSDSRAFNVDGRGLTVNNNGVIAATGRQRNGTLYVDGTASEFTINNGQNGRIDASGGFGSGVSVQVGTAPDSVQTGSIINSGTIIGSGAGFGIGDQAIDAGVRLFAGAEGATFQGDIINNLGGVISADNAPAVLVESGVTFEGELFNAGTIDGGISLATGDLVLADTSELLLSIEDFDAGLFDSIDVGGNFDFGGTLALSFGAGLPAVGDALDLFSFATATGSFDQIIADGVTFDTSELVSLGRLSVSSVTAVPEPSSFAILVAMGLLARRQRRRKQTA